MALSADRDAESRKAVTAEARHLSVALVCAGFPPDIGGVELVVHEHAIALSRLGCRVEVLTEGRACHSQVTESLTVRRFRTVRLGAYSLSPALTARLRAAAGQFDIVHVHNYHWPGALLASVATPSKVVFSPHYHGKGRSSGASRVERMMRPLGGAVLRNSAALVAVSQVERETLIRSFPSLVDRVEVIANQVSPDPMLNRDSVDDGLVLSIGRLEPYKGVDRLIAAMSTLPTTVRLIVVGHGPDIGRLRGQVDSLGLGARVEFVGRVDDDNLRRLRDRAGAVVSLSAQEAYGLTVAQALADGIPVVASDIPAHRALVDDGAAGGDAALVALVDSRDRRAVGRAIAQALQDGKQRAAAEARPAGWSGVGHQLLALYTRVLAS